MKELTPKEVLELCKDNIVAIAIDQDGDWIAFTEIPQPKLFQDGWSNCWIGGGDEDCSLPLKIKYDGDWKDSLTVREKPFEITETGLYRTKGGRRAFISYKTETCFYGVIETCAKEFQWGNKGYCIAHCNEDNDIISKWTEE